MLKPGFIYYTVFAILFISFGAFILFAYKPINSMLGSQFFTFFGAALMILGALRAFRAFQIIRKK